MNSLRYYVPLYRRFISVNFRSQMQYRVSFIADLVGNFLLTILDLATVGILLTRFRAIGGWTLGEVLFLYGSSAVSFSLAELIAGGFDDFDAWVVRGEFDQVLLRPLPITFQMLTARFHVRRVGRLAQAVIALIFAFTLLDLRWDAGDIVFFAVMLLGGTLLFLSIFIAGATFAFWAPQAHESVNILTYGGQFMLSYPLHIYQQWMVSFFTFIIPMAFINYYPSLHLLGKPDPLGLPWFMPFLSPIVAVIAFRVTLALWRTGVKHYQSTGT